MSDTDPRPTCHYPVCYSRRRFEVRFGAETRDLCKGHLDKLVHFVSLFDTPLIFRVIYEYPMEDPKRPGVRLVEQGVGPEETETGLR
jgi:hypothetical protein